MKPRKRTAVTSSNGLLSTWMKHNRVLGGHLGKILAVLPKVPGLVERNENRLKAYAEKQSKLLEVLGKDPTPEVESTRR